MRQYGADLLSTMDGDVDAARSMAVLFFETASEQIAMIESAVSGSSREGISFPAHKCAGGASACGFSDLAAALRALELNAAEMDRVALESSLAHILSIFEDTRKEVMKFYGGVLD